MGRQLKYTLIFLGVFTLITGLIYPLSITGIAQVIFNYQANGSLVTNNDSTVGSELIGQPFSDPEYFWGRPSATNPYSYNADASSGSNLGPSNSTLKDIVQARIDALQQVDPDNHNPIPIDLVTASGSGLDPHISIAAAYYQIPRVARVRNLSEAQVTTLVEESISGRQFGILGEPRVNVLQLNLALDELR